jgi:hypothetical protein
MAGFERWARVVLLSGLLLALAASAANDVESRQNLAPDQSRPRAESAIVIDYPEDGSIFPS